jgi:hypothetical protein
MRIFPAPSVVGEPAGLQIRTDTEPLLAHAENTTFHFFNDFLRQADAAN